MGIAEKIPLFSALDEEQRAGLEQQLLCKVFQDNEMIFDFEDASRDVLFILSGKVRVLYRSVLGREVILADLEAPEFFGELAAIDQQARSANVTALQRTEIAICPQAVFLNLATHVPAISEALLQTLTARIRALDARFSEMSVLKSNERLYAELLRLSRPRASQRGQRIISPPPLHHHLAARIGCRREVVSRELSRLIKQGILEKTRGGLVLVDVPVLEARLAEALS